MKFRDFFSLKHIIFAVVIIALMIPFAINQANKLVQVELKEEKILISSSKYSISVTYEEIESAELADLPAEGEKVAQTFNDNLLRTGVWKDETLGEYMMCCYMDTQKCVILHLTDGTTVVFSTKSLSATTEIYDEILTHIS